MNEQLKKEELINRIKAHERIIYKICNSYCSNMDDRPDLAQEIIYQLLKSYHSFKEEYKFSTWMYRIALNVAITFYRKAKTGKQVIMYEECQEEIEDEGVESIELEKNIHTLQQFINQLKELDKALMILYLEEKSYKEMAEILGISETNVATKISRIKDRLKQQFINQNI